MRRSLVLLLATLAFGSAVAAPVTYEFRAFVGTYENFTPGRGENFGSLTPNKRFVGTLTFDPARMENGAVAPVVDLKLAELESGQVLIQGNALESSLETRAANGVESAVITARAESGDTGAVVTLSWASPGQGQLPADPRTLNILALQPYGWKIVIDGYEVFPCESALCRDDRVEGQIYEFKRAAAAAEYQQTFRTPPPLWTNTGGSWAAQSGFFANAANVAFTSSVYGGQTLQPFVEVSADLYSEFSGSGNALGLLLNYRNASNFYEVRFAANGVVTINKVANGVRTTLQTGSYSAPPRTLFHVSVLRDFSSIEVRVNNAPAIVAEDGTLADGRAGVFASWNRARFDNFAIDQLSDWGDSLTTDFFAPNPFVPRSGTWVIQGGTYRSTSNQVAAVSTLGPSRGGDFALYARVKLQWPGSGNRGGLVWDYRDARNYSAVLVSPSTSDSSGFHPGTAQIIDVVAGVRRVVASSTNVSLPLQFFGDLSISRVDGVVRVATSGLSEPFVVRLPARGGDIGLIASWDLVQFDDVVFRSQSGPL